MRVLWVATKPPLPATDGGRLLTVETLAALAEAGVRGTVVFPGTATAAAWPGWRLLGVPATRAWWPGRRTPAARSRVVARHVAPGVARAVAELLASEPFDVVHAEQVHALPQCRAATAARHVPVVLRAQNVEHEALAARPVPRLARPLLDREIRRLREFEADAVRTVAATVALSDADATRLRALAGPHGRVVSVAAPFPAERPSGPPLDGAPAVVLFGSRGWFPNRPAAARFVARAWPAVHARLPAARLHVFGLPVAAASGVVAHRAPADSATAFARGAVFVVPSDVRTGIRMKILEAWARGVPVVSTPEAAAGLHLEADPLVVAADPEAVARAVATLHEDPALAGRHVAAGRATLRRHHDPATLGARLLAVYEAAARRLTSPATDRPRPGPAAR